VSDPTQGREARWNRDLQRSSEQKFNSVMLLLGRFFVPFITNLNAQFNVQNQMQYEAWRRRFVSRMLYGEQILELYNKVMR